MIIVEPNPLARWALKTYFDRWFAVLSTDSAPAARRVLARVRVHALIVSDELGNPTAAAIEREAHERNPRLESVVTVVEPCNAREFPPRCRRLVKPFDLAELARLLHVPPVRSATGAKHPKPITPPGRVDPTANN